MLSRSISFVCVYVFVLFDLLKPYGFCNSKITVSFSNRGIFFFFSLDYCKFRKFKPHWQWCYGNARLPFDRIAYFKFDLYGTIAFSAYHRPPTSAWGRERQLWWLFIHSFCNSFRCQFPNREFGFFVSVPWFGGCLVVDKPMLFRRCSSDLNHVFFLLSDWFRNIFPNYTQIGILLNI